MMDKRDRLERRGQRDNFTGANTGAALKLASWLPGCGLEKLTDAECAALVSQINKLTDEAIANGFRCGWDDALRYNTDMAYLRGAPLTTGH